MLQRTMVVNEQVHCDGSSIWTNSEGISGIVQRIEVRGYVGRGYVGESCDWILVDVYHDIPMWEIYTDKGFECDVSRIISDHLGIGVDVSFTEQGMQELGIASMEPVRKRSIANLFNWLDS